MEFGQIVLFEFANYTIYIEVSNFILLTGSLVLQGLMFFRFLSQSVD